MKNYDDDGVSEYLVGFIAVRASKVLPPSCYPNPLNPQNKPGGTSQHTDKPKWISYQKSAMAELISDVTMEICIEEKSFDNWTFGWVKSFDNCFLKFSLTSFLTTNLFEMKRKQL